MSVHVYHIELVYRRLLAEVAVARSNERCRATHVCGDHARLLLSEGVYEEEQIHNSLHLQLLQNTAQHTERTSTTDGCAGTKIQKRSAQVRTVVDSSWRL